MRAIKLRTRVNQDHTLRLDLPPDVNAGPAEVIVLLPEEPRSATQSVEEYLTVLEATSRSTRSTEKLDRALATERPGRLRILK